MLSYIKEKNMNTLFVLKDDRVFIFFLSLDKRPVVKTIHL